MKPYWENTAATARLDKREEVKPLIETNFEDAQGAVNFVVFQPEWLPADCHLAKVTLRPEQPPGRPGGVESREIGQTPWTEANPCSVRAVFRGRRRAFRLKQFLYDWAPPAASTAPLWNSPYLTPVSSKRAIAWLGTDYHQRPGGCVQLLRTQIELSVVAGEFDDGDLGRVLSGLVPAAPKINQVVQEAPFHLLNYWVRYRLRGVKVPYGLWHYHQPRYYDQSHLVSLDDLRYNAPLRILLPSDNAYIFDSAVIINGVKAAAREVELVFRHQENASDHLWLVAMNQKGERAFRIPPDPEKHLAETRESMQLRNTKVWYGALTEQYGAWEAIWEEDQFQYALWAGSSAFQHGRQFQNLVEGLQIV